MLITAIVLFVIAAVFGFIILLNVLKKQATPKPAVYAHGALAAIALGIVAYYVLTHAENSPVTSLGVFLIAAVGGFILFSFDLTQKRVPIGLALIHAGAAAVGLVLLILFTFA